MTEDKHVYLLSGPPGITGERGETGPPLTAEETERIKQECLRVVDKHSVTIYCIGVIFGVGWGLALAFLIQKIYD